MIFFSLFFTAIAQQCYYNNYQDCMNTPLDYCIYDKEKRACHNSNNTNLGCLSTMNKNLCLIQNPTYLCQYLDSCRSIDKQILKTIGCEKRLISKGSCLITNDLCIWNNQENRCQTLQIPNTKGKCQLEDDEGNPLIMTALVCSQIRDKSCVWDEMNYNCMDYQNFTQGVCEEIGLSRLACIKLETIGQNCIYEKQNIKCNENCAKTCQQTKLDKCDQGMNQNACFKVQSEACSFTEIDGCQQVISQGCNNKFVNYKTCIDVQTELCFYNQKTFSCEIPDKIINFNCNSMGINRLLCLQLSDLCIFDKECRFVTDQELYYLQCSDIVSKLTCLSIKTESQYCQWNEQQHKCQEIQISKLTQCTTLKLVNGNSCQAVVYDSCKLDKFNCIMASKDDDCETDYINLIGCSQILKFQTACQWKQNKCQRVKITENQKCEDLQLVNPIVCSMFYIFNVDSDFRCYYDDQFKWFNYTCRYDEDMKSCRQLKKEEFQTLKCGDYSLGLNAYACSLIQTPGQVCRYRNSQCTASDSQQQYQVQCSIIQYGNPSSCAYTTYKQQPCKFNLNTCGCIQSANIQKDKCNTLGMNSIGCSQLKTEKCYFDTGIIFSCQPKKDDIQNIKCELNSPNQKLCVSVTTKGELCKWSTLDQICKYVSVDPSQSCQSYQLVSPNVCTLIDQLDPGLGNKGYCYYDEESSSCKSWSPNKQCLQSCCTDLIGINIHVCSAKTNFNDSYCYFENQICHQYQVKNQLDLQKIQVLFKNQRCEQFNFKMCGLINPNLDNIYYCYQSSTSDRCITLKQSEYLGFDKKEFLLESVRSNVWTCIQIDDQLLKVQYDQNIGKCTQITKIIKCQEYFVNKQACLQLTQLSYCQWDPLNYKCLEILNFDQINCNSLINKNSCLTMKQCRYNNILFQCENIQTIDQSTKCLQLAQDYSYHDSVCRMINDGTPCVYDYQQYGCKRNTDIIQKCNLYGQNKQSCLLNTLGSCKWNQETLLCEDIIFDLNSGCDPNFNKYSCMKVTSQKCYFDTKCQQLTEIFSCDELVYQSKLLAKFFNQRTCISIDAPGQLCGYDLKNFKCLNYFLDSDNKQIQNYKCTQFPMNIHLCLSYTQGSYCYFNTTSYQCIDYQIDQPFQNCSAINLNRDVCVNSLSSCKYNKLTSKCEVFQYNQEYCSDLQSTQTYLYGQMVCKKVQNPKQKNFKDAYKICHAFQCDFQSFCYYDQQEQGCKIIQYVEPQQKFIDEQKSCLDMKRQLRCDKYFNKYGCLYLTDFPCYFDSNDNTCKSFDSYSNIAKCDEVSYLGCSKITTIGQNCFVLVQDVIPYSCNFGLKQFKICQNINLAPKIIVNQTTQYTYSQCEYFTLNQIVVNSNTCSQLQNCKAIFDEEYEQCVLVDQITGCTNLGQTEQLCQQNSQQGCSFNQSIKSCQQTLINNVVNNCSSIQTLKVYDLQNILNQAYQCANMPNCAFYNQQNSEKLPTLLVNETYCQFCIDRFDNLNKDQNDCYKMDHLTEQFYVCDKQYNNRDCGNKCIFLSLSNGNYYFNNDSLNLNNSFFFTDCQINYQNYELNCSCLGEISRNFDKCIQDIESKRIEYQNDPLFHQSCLQYKNQCQETNLITDENEIISTYLTMPESLCIQLNGFSAKYIKSNYTCLKSQDITRCAGNNKQACLIYSNNLYCIWRNSQCQKLSTFELKGITDCSIVNLNSCLLIGAICYIQNQQCLNQIQSGTCDSSNNIQSEFTCSQLKQNQCYFNTEIGLCQQIKDYQQLYDCKTPGLNYQACFINTNQYCKFQNTCQQITDLTIVGCEGLNIKGCVEHPSLPCMWDNIKLQCSQVLFSNKPTCNQFQSIMPLDYQVNVITCYQITTFPCIYKNKQCQTPLDEQGCKSQIYNYQGCIQSTNQICQAVIGKINFQTMAPLQINCLEIGDINQVCDPSLNKYACRQMIGCLFKDNVCQQYSSELQSQVLQLQINPYICQNIQGQSLIYKNSKCDLATEFYECQTPYMNKETCLQKTLGYCQYLQANVINFKDTEQRCIKYQNYKLYTQKCDISVNYNICSDIVNYACVFKQGICQQFNQQIDTCQTLSQIGIYASIQACTQTQDVKCAYDTLNKRCQIVSDISNINCDNLGVNQLLCVQVIKYDNKCEFITSEFQQQIKKQCDFATKIQYSCNNIISMNQCVLIENCKFQNNQCQQINYIDSQKCLKEFQVNGQICSQAQDFPCDYDSVTYKCIINPSPLNESYQLLNNLACIKSKINKPLIFKNNKCQQVNNFNELTCNQNLNLLSCKNVNQSQKCIFKQKCGQDYSTFCQENQFINNPKICELTTDIPCKYFENRCVPALNTQSECLSQGINILACLQSNLIKCSQCTELILNSKCIQAETENLCMSLIQPCVWQNNKCLAFEGAGQQCQNLPDRINKYVCFQINMQIDQECIYDQQTNHCKQQTVTNCENLNSLKSCTLNTILKCVWINEQCIQKDTIRNLDQCKTYLTSLQFCKAIERFDSDCEFINGVCQESQYQQNDWQLYVNRQSCIKQRYNFCYWEDSQCICPNQDQLQELQLSQICNQELSFLLCLSIKTHTEYCQFIHGQCTKLVLQQDVIWNQYQLINPNVCTQVTSDPVNYDEQKFICNIFKNNQQDCETLGINKLSCLLIETQSCIWINNRCKMQNSDNKRILIEQDIIVNSIYCSKSLESVYYQNNKCLPIDADTQCNAVGISQNGCLNIQSEPCRWYEEESKCELAYPIEECEQNPTLVNAIYCQKVEIGSCKYENNKCIEAKEDTKVINPGLNQLACVQIAMAIFDKSCTQMLNNQICPLFKYSNPFACKQAIDNCVYDPIDKQCQKLNYGEDCDDYSLSKAACQQLQFKQCVYYDNFCTCNSLISVQCLYTDYQQCQRNNLCYWEENNCKITQCSGQNQDCQSQRNCYSRMKDKQIICDYASKCEDIQYDNTLYKGCQEIIINNVQCVSDIVGCKTFQCSSLQKIECANSYFGQLSTFDYCIVQDNTCVQKQCIEIYLEAECVKRPDCFFFSQSNLKWGCQQFTQCSEAQQEYVCNQIQIYSNKQYIPCSWINDQCIMNPCNQLGIDKYQCNGVHINNKYVCALDQTDVMCNACEMYNKGCDCLSKDKYCQWDTNLQICQSLPCQKMNKDLCVLRQDCLFDMGYCKTSCQFHFNQFYCKKYDCFWDDSELKCSSCDINSCKDEKCSNTYCCEMKILNEQEQCTPRCERITKQQCNNQCIWSYFYESCIWQDQIQLQNTGDMFDNTVSNKGLLIGILILLSNFNVI